MTKKTIVITGCSSGFGRHTALDLAMRGWHVFATVRKDNDRENLLNEAASRQCQDNLSVVLCDITLEEQVARLVHDVEQSLREEVTALDALLNNAGTAYGGPIEIMPLEDLRAQFEINVIAHMRMIQAFLPLIRAAKGTIINVSSVGGQISVPATGAYSASKYALEALTDALRIEVAPFGVRVVLIEPSSSPTGIWKTSLDRSLAKLGAYKEHGPYARLLTFVERSATHSSRKGFPIQRFTDTVVRILSTNKPRARYAVPRSAELLLLVRRFLPDSLLDFLIRRAMKW